MARLNLGNRLSKLEPCLLPPPGCGTCRGWTGVLLVGEDGPHRPEICPGCGRAVPARVTVRVIGVEIGLV